MTAEQSRPSRRLRIALFASLALNLAVVGLIAGVVLRGGPPDRSTPFARDASLPFVTALEREDRRAVGRALREALAIDGGRRAARAERRALYDEAISLLSADLFDAQAFAALQERQAMRVSRFQKAGQAALLEHLQLLDKTERRAYAERLADAVAHGRRAQ